jgi:small subunit ribosomal protein S17
MENKTEKVIKKIVRKLTGTVVSDKMTDTVVVAVSRYVKHKKYQKFQTLTKKFKVDDKGNTAKIGDKVVIVECKPISKDKHFKLDKIVK